MNTMLNWSMVEAHKVVYAMGIHTVDDVVYIRITTPLIKIC